MIKKLILRNQRDCEEKIILVEVNENLTEKEILIKYLTYINYLQFCEKINDFSYFDTVEWIPFSYEIEDYEPEIIKLI